MDAATLRLILIVVGAAFLLVMYLWERSRAEQRDNTDDWDNYLGDQRGDQHEPTLGSLQPSEYDDDLGVLADTPSAEPDTAPDTVSDQGLAPESEPYALRELMPADNQMPLAAETADDDAIISLKIQAADEAPGPESDQEPAAGSSPDAPGFEIPKPELPNSEIPTSEIPTSEIPTSEIQATHAQPSDAGEVEDGERATSAGMQVKIEAEQQGSPRAAQKSGQKPAFAASPAADANVNSTAPDMDQGPLLIQLFVVATGQPFAGERILSAARHQKLMPGKMDIFHRQAPDDGTRAPLYSMANLVKPGSFPMRNMRDFKTPGLALFAQLEGDPSDLMVYDDLLHVARALASELGGQVQEKGRRPLTEERAQALRAQVSAKLQLSSAPTG